MHATPFPIHFALIRPQQFAASVSHLDALRDRASLTHTRRVQQEDEDYVPWWKTEDLWGDPLPAPQKVGTTSLIPIKGVITSGLPTIYRAVHFADTDEIAGWVRSAAADTSVRSIVLSIDSPGGFVTGTPELAAEVAHAAEQKPVYAHTKGMMDSAAYWIGSQATAVYCTPSADVGCIGVYQVYYDWSAFLQEIGVTAEIFKDSDLKATGHPHIPLTDDQRDHIQAEIDLIGEQFRTAVTAKRTMVDGDSMRGQSFLGTEAVSRHLCAGLRPLSSLL